MKRQFQLTLTHVLSILGTFFFSFLLSQGVFADASFEVMCRGKAKEIAAETYKGCMTEYRQTQLEQIRKEYKEELSQLKNQYDKKLKKLTGKASPVSSPVNQQSNSPAQNGAESVNSPDADGSSTSNIEPSTQATTQATVHATTQPTVQLKRTRQRSSGARMPTKKIGSGTQVIDLSKSVDTQLNSGAVIAESTRREKTDPNENSDIEIVELPVQE